MSQKGKEPLYEINDRIREHLENAGIRIEYSSILDESNQFIFRQKDDDRAIIVPRKTVYSKIEANWVLAHEYGHYLIQQEMESKAYSLNRLQKERLAWEKGKVFLTELHLPLTEGSNTYETFAERKLATYKTQQENIDEDEQIDRSEPRKRSVKSYVIQYGIYALAVIILILLSHIYPMYNIALLAVVVHLLWTFLNDIRRW